MKAAEELESGIVNTLWRRGLKGEERAWYLEEDIGRRENFYCRCEPCLHMREEPVGYQVGCGGSSKPRGKKYFITDVDQNC